MRMLIGGEWLDGTLRKDVTISFDGSVIDTVPVATSAAVLAGGRAPDIANPEIYRRAPSGRDDDLGGLP